MPILDLGTVMSRGTTLAGGRNDWQPSEASFWANLALEQVSEMAGAHHKPREAVAISSTTSGGNRIALPTDFGFPIAVTVYAGSNSTATTSRTTNEYPLIPKDSTWADAQPDQFSGNIPENYVWYGTWLELYPSPNSAYSLQMRYGALQPTLIDSSDTPDLNARWHQPWLYKTNELLCASRGDVNGEALGRNRFQNAVSLIETDKALSQHDRRGMHLTNGLRRRNR